MRRPADRCQGPSVATKSPPQSPDIIIPAHSFVAVHLLPNKATQADRVGPLCAEGTARLAD